VEHFGSAIDALQADANDLEPFPGFGDKIRSQWNTHRKNSEWKKHIEVALNNKTEMIPFTSPKYPKRLLELPDHPILLYVQGNLDPVDQRSIAIVGTRASSIYGNEMAQNISADLAARGFTVVSGLARGVDTYAHQGALSRGRTIAVIGSGLANIYPPENIRLAAKIAEKGAIMSEFPMLTPPDRQNFPQRNRIVSGMTLGTVLIEAPEKSGAMITMHKAFLQQRPLFALPGRVDNENFKGNHLLIKSGKAQLVENAYDIASAFESLLSFKPEPFKGDFPIFSLESEEKDLLKVFPSEEVSFDTLAANSQLHASKLTVLLMSLIIKKVVREFPGKRYKKLVVKH
jgi:DNA processing protein